MIEMQPADQTDRPDGTMPDPEPAIEMSQGARLVARVVDVGDWGADAVLPQVNFFERSLRDFLIENGFTIRTYDSDPNGKSSKNKAKILRPAHEAFYKGEAELRKEPILIDSGGRIVDRRPVLSIAVRPYAEGPELRHIVAQMMLAAGIHPVRAMRTDETIDKEVRPEDLGTIVYRIRGHPDFGWRGWLVETGQRVKEALFPKPQPQPH